MNKVRIISMIDFNRFYQALQSLDNEITILGTSEDIVVTDWLEAKGYNISYILDCLNANNLDKDETESNIINLDILGNERKRKQILENYMDTIENTSGGIFKSAASIKKPSIKGLKTHRNLLERAESKIRENGETEVKVPAVESSVEPVYIDKYMSIKQELVNSKPIQIYWKNYEEVRNIGWHTYEKTRLISFISYAVTKQVADCKAAYIAALGSSTSRGAWSGGWMTGTKENGTGSIAYGTNGDQYSSYSISGSWNDPFQKNSSFNVSINASNSQWKLEGNKHNTMVQVNINETNGKITYTSEIEPDNATPIALPKYTGEVTYRQLLEKSKAFQTDENIVHSYEDATLGSSFAAVVKKHYPNFNINKKVIDFQKILGYSAIAYVFKRTFVAEKKINGKFMNQMILKLAESGNLHYTFAYIKEQSYEEKGRIYQVMDGKDQKLKAKASRYWASEEVALDRVARNSILNSSREYHRLINDGLSSKIAERAANLTFFSDLLVFDSFIYSAPTKDIKLDFTKKDATIAYYSRQALPIVITQEVKLSKTILAQERLYKYLPKYTNFVLSFEKLKYEAFRAISVGSYEYYKQYLGFHPVHRTLRFTKDKVILPTEKWIENWGNNSLWTKVSTDLFKSCNFVVFSLTRAVIHLPKHIYKDTKALTEQLVNLINGGDTWAGIGGGIWRDIKGPCKAVEILGENALVLFLPEILLNPTYRHHLFHQDKNLGELIADAWNYEWNKDKIKLALTLHKVNAPIRKGLSEITKGKIPNPSALFFSRHANLNARKNQLALTLLLNFRIGIKAKLQNHSGAINSAITIAKSNKLKTTRDLLLLSQGGKVSIHGRTISSKEINNAFQSLITNMAENYIASTGYTKKQEKTLIINNLASSEFRNGLQAWAQRQLIIFQNEMKAFKFINQHGSGFKYLAFKISIANKINRGIKDEGSYLKNQVGRLWHQGRANTFFFKALDKPLEHSFNALSTGKKTNEANKQLNHFQRNHKPGEKLFADILITETADKVVKSIGNIHSKFKNGSYDFAASKYSKVLPFTKKELFLSMRLHQHTAQDIEEWRTRIKITNRIGKITLDQASLAKLKNATFKGLLTKVEQNIHLVTAVDSSLVKIANKESSILNKPITVQDVITGTENWWDRAVSKGYFYQHWKTVVTTRSSHNAALAALLNDVEILQGGGSMTFGQFINSLPQNKDWNLTLVPQAIPSKGPSSIFISKINIKAGVLTPKKVNQAAKQKVKVPIMLFKNRIKFARKIWNKLFGKKEDLLVDIEKAEKKSIIKVDEKRIGKELGEDELKELEDLLAEDAIKVESEAEASIEVDESEALGSLDDFIDTTLTDAIDATEDTIADVLV